MLLYMFPLLLYLWIYDKQSMIPEAQKNITTHWCSMGRQFTAATNVGFIQLMRLIVVDINMMWNELMRQLSV